MIMLGGQEAASNTDILQGTRLQSMPRNGTLTLELQASDYIAANHYTVTVLLPNGETPLENVPVPQGAGAGVTGIIDRNEKLMVAFRVAQGGHVVFSCTETGDTEMAWRATFR